MVGAEPKFDSHVRACQVISPGTTRHVRPSRWRRVAVTCLFVPLAAVLVQCGKAPNAGMLAANTQADNTQVASGDSFDDRFPAPQFRDRFPTEQESFV